MHHTPSRARAGTLAVAVAAVLIAGTACAGETSEEQLACDEDVMLVFDGSGSMAGSERLGIGSFVTRLDKVRVALGQVLPNVAPHRRIGLVTYGPGPYNRCDNIELNLRPIRNAARPILDVIERLVPAGRTPLTAAVEQAAEVLDYKRKAGTVVLLTDGEETCDGNPCELAKRLKAEAAGLVVHVIGYKMKDFSWTGGSGILEMRCLVDTLDGQYFSVETTEELIAALSKTLGCPMLTERDPSAAGRTIQTSGICPLTDGASRRRHMTIASCGR